MKIYLVGGAVRDELLDFPVIENDWVVVGADPQQLIQLGYEKIGKDFPVFLHPATKEEYALARTERKTGRGYTGFECYAAADVTLEDDLARRDLTINAIAKDKNGKYIDPYGGMQDIENRILRHVSPAFTEDPLRILRIARFASRYAHLGFTIAKETEALMANMVASGEVKDLVPERIWKETKRALSQEKPRVYFEVLRSCGALAELFPELDALFGVPQVPEHHPEIDCGLHALMALDQACTLSKSAAVRFSALFHDLGKAVTKPDVLPHHYGHETATIPIAKALCSRLTVPNSYRDLLLIAAEYHTHCHKALELRSKTLVKLFKKLDAFRKPQRFYDFLLVCEADARGRTGLEKRPYPQTQFLKGAFEACREIETKPFIEQGLQGEQLGEAIQRQRISLVKQYKDDYNAH